MKKTPTKSHLRRFAGYMVGGGAQFWTGYGSFALFYSTLSWNFWWAKAVSYLIGASVNYVLQKEWVFKDSSRAHSTRQSAPKFYSLMALNFLLDLLIVGGLRELGLSPYIGQFVSAGFFTVFNYLVLDKWVFKKKRS